VSKETKIVVEASPDGYVAHVLGPEGVFVGERNTCEEALADAKLAIRFHVETFGQDELGSGPNGRQKDLG